MLRGQSQTHARVLRGGAFNNNEDNVRCAIRNRNNPDNRNRNVGFRVLLSTLFHTLAGNARRGNLPRRGVKNGGDCPWPRSTPLPSPRLGRRAGDEGAGQIATAPLPG